jgi:galactokinase/mevalonate kinase-like predicted kinase
MGCRLIGSGGNGFVMTIVDNPNDFVAKLQTNNVRYTGVSFDYDGAKLLKTGD